MKTGIAGVLLLGVALVGCQTTETRYGNVNGMAYCKNCKAMIVGTSNSTKVVLPSGGYVGANVDLGSIDKSETRAALSKTLGVINQSVVSACEGQKAAAFSGDRATYDTWAKVQQNQIVKLQQLEELMVGQETATAPAAAAAPAATPTSVAAAAATPKPTAKKDTKLQKWASVYSSKNHGKLNPCRNQSGQAEEDRREPRGRRADSSGGDARGPSRLGDAAQAAPGARAYPEAVNTRHDDSVPLVIPTRRSAERDLTSVVRLGDARKTLVRSLAFARDDKGHL